MRSLHIIGACFTLVACGSAAGSGDADDDGIDIAGDTLAGDHGGITGPVVVEPTRLLIQRAGNEAFLDSAGRVLVGSPQKTAGNAYGFLRRATGAKVLADGRIQIDTTNAALGDAIKTGAVEQDAPLVPSSLSITPQAGTISKANGRGLSVTIGQKTLDTFNFHFKDPTNLLPTSEFDVSRTVTLQSAEIHFEPSIELGLSLSGGQLKTFDAIAKGSLDASFQLTVDNRASIALDKNAPYRETLKGSLRTPPIRVTLFQTEPYVLPVQWVGWVPIVETVRFSVILECDLDLTSQMHMDSGLSLKSTASFGTRYSNGNWQPAPAPTFAAKPNLAMSLSGSVAGSCGVRTEVGFYFYDLVGPTLSVTPYVDFTVSPNVNVDGDGLGFAFDWSATPGIRAAFGGRVQVPVLGTQLFRTDVVLFDKKVGTPFVGGFAE